MSKEEIESKMKYLLEDKKEKGLTLKVHPYLASYFTNGLFNSRQMKWFFKYKTWVKVQSITANNLLQYSFVNKENEEIAILPMKGRVVIFESQVLEHEVKPVKKERLSITGWLKTRKI